MAFPESVNTIHLTRARGGRPSRRSKDPEYRREDDISSGVGPGGPLLDYGYEGATKLERRGKAWEWVWINQDRQGIKVEIKDEAQMMFPPTALVDQSSPSSPDIALTSARKYIQSIEQDADLSDLMPIIEEEVRLSSVKVEDVYKGNVLKVIQNNKGKIARHFVCFPTGLLGNHLNISPLLPPSNVATFGRSVCRFLPIAKPAYRFPTEILQIEISSVTSSRLDKDATIMIVRLHSCTHLFRVTPNQSFLPPTDEPSNHVELLATLTPGDTKGSRHVDVALDEKAWCKALIVDDSGAVWLWYEERKEVEDRVERLYKLKRIRPSVPGEDRNDGFYRIAFGTRMGTALVVDRKNIWLLDLDKSQTAPVKMMSLTGQGREFVCLDKSALARSSTYTVAVTTYEVLLFDELDPGPPVLSWSHHLDPSMKNDLELSIVQLEDQRDMILLSSPKDKSVMMFHLALDPPIRSLAAPQCIALPLSTDNLPLRSMSGMAISRYRSMNNATCLIGSSPNGALWSVPVGRVEDTRSARTRTLRSGEFFGAVRTELKVEWDEDIAALAEKDDSGEQEKVWDEMGKGKRITRYSEIDGRWAWLAINERKPSKSDSTFSTGHLEQYVRELDAPFDHFLTAGDIARDASSRKRSRTLSHLLQHLPLPEDIDAELGELIELDFSRHISMVHTFPIISSGALEEEFPVPRNLRVAFAHVANRMEVDRQQLALDLTLSSKALHTDDISSTSAAVPLQDTQTSESDAADDISVAAGQLTLNEPGPPNITFSFLQPKGSDLLNDQDTSIQTLFQNPTARSLMTEWEVGTNPSEFVWKPFRQEPEVQPSSTTQSGRLLKPLPSPRPMQPPKIAMTQPMLRPAGSVPTLRPAPPILRSSPPPSAAPQSSQSGPPLIQTQVERGPFGGRPIGQKKKPKKRVGGF